MIEVVENNHENIILQKYPTKRWFAFFILTIFAILINYQALFNAPIYSSLTCDRSWLKTVNCKLIESPLFKSNSRHQIINNIHEPKGILRNGTIWLNTEVDLLHNQIKNNYFPSHSFLGFFDIYLYRFRGQAVNEVKQINNFIHSRGKKYKLEVTRNIFPLFYLPLLLLPVTILIGIFGILIQPITTYIFNFQENNLTVLEKSLFTSDRRTHLIDKLTITSADQKQDSILLNTKTEISYLLDDFQNPQQALKAIDKLKQKIK